MNANGLVSTLSTPASETTEKALLGLSSGYTVVSHPKPLAKLIGSLGTKAPNQLLLKPNVLPYSKSPFLVFSALGTHRLA